MKHGSSADARCSNILSKSHAAFAGDPVLLQTAYVPGTLYDSFSMLFPLQNLNIWVWVPKYSSMNLTLFSTSSRVDRSI